VTNPAAIALKVKSLGGPAIDPAASTGQASADGVSIAWRVAPSANGSGQITVTIMKKPWMIPYSTVWGHIDAVFNG
jgi:hypothetical protein